MAQTSLRKSTNLSLDQKLLADAKMLKVNLSRAAEEGIREAVRRTQEAEWKRENEEALQSSNDFVDQNGLPLARQRLF